MAMDLGMSLAPGSGGVNLLAQVLALSPSALYDPSDLTSLYQSRTGGSTGAVGSVVGIMLDKSQMGGATAADFIAGQSEFTTNGDFTAGFTGWSAQAGWSASGGAAVVNSSTAGSTYLRTSTAGTVGVLYQITFTVVSYTSGSIAPAAGTANETSVSAPGTYTRLIVCSGLGGVGVIANGTNTVATVDNISVKAIPGKHALTPSDAARPLLRAGYYVDFDGVDDLLNAVIAANLGSSCSVYYRTQAGSNSWTDGATISAGNYALSTTDFKRAAIFPALPSDAQKAIVEAWGAS